MKKSNSAERLKYLMRIMGIKQTDIIEKTGIPKSAMSMYISGQRVPRQDRISEIADAYNINEAWLMGYDVPMERNAATENSQKILTPKDERDIERKLTETLDQIVSGDGLMFSGDVMDEQTKKLLEISLRNTLESAKITAKKFTPKKYK